MYIRKYILRFVFSNQYKKYDNHFGFQDISTEQKQPLINEVFHSVATKYDLMNDAMSIGIHRYWKNQFVQQLGILTPHSIHPPQIIKVLDVAGGTGDISLRILDHHNHRNIKAIVFDINESMLKQGTIRAKQIGLRENEIQFICGNAQQLPFDDNTFDAYTISFGLRNVPRTQKALQEAKRVLKKGGRFLCLEFSKVLNPLFREIYRNYSFSVIPTIGKLVTGDSNSYQYLVESIERFLSQQQLKKMMMDVGFSQCQYTNLTNGIVAIHSGYKLQ